MQKTYASRSFSSNIQAATRRPRRVRSKNGISLSVPGEEKSTNVVKVPDPVHNESTTNKILSKNKPTKYVKDQIEFRRRADEYCMLLNEKLKPMQAWNDIFRINQTSNDFELQLQPDLGTFTLHFDDELCMIEMTSPRSGSFTYVYCTETNRWRGKDDGHDLNGMLVRDLIQLSNGVPDL